MKKRTLLKSMALPLGLHAAGSQAQGSSGRPIRIIVPLSTGTPSDAITRLLAPGLSAILGQTIIIENKPGANGLLAVQDVMRAAPDGTTLMMSSVSALAINMALVKNLSYDSRRDFTPIAGAYSANHVWAVKPNFPARTMPEFIAYLKKNPGKLNVAHSSSLQQIQLAAFNQMAGTEMLMVPYKSTATSFTDFLGGTLDLSLMDTASALSYVKGGQARALGVSSSKRNPTTPDWPSIADTVPGFDFSSWSAFVGPAGMPADVVNRINAAVAQVLKQKEIVDKLTESGLVPMILTSNELKAHIASEVAKSIKVAREANIQPE